MAVAGVVGRRLEPVGARSRHAAGTTLQRQYHDRTITVKILADGFEYDGKIYESLSSIASSVTGTRWNGFAFFQLNKKGAA